MLEVGWCCILFLLGFAVSGYVDGILAGKVIETNEGAIEAKAKARIIEDFLQTVELPQELNNQIRNASSSSAVARDRLTRGVTKKLPFPMRQRIARRTFMPYFQNAASFNGCTDSFLVEIGTSCRFLEFSKDA